MGEITAETAQSIVALFKRLHEARDYVRRVDAVKPRSGKFSISGYTTDGREANYEAGGPEVCEVVRGYIRREHQKIAADCERKLRALGAVVPDHPTTSA